MVSKARNKRSVDLALSKASSDAFCQFVLTWLAGDFLRMTSNFALGGQTACYRIQIVLDSDCVVLHEP